MRVFRGFSSIPQIAMLSPNPTCNFIEDVASCDDDPKANYPPGVPLDVNATNPTRAFLFMWSSCSTAEGN